MTRTEKIIEPIFDDLGYFNSGLAKVRLSNIYGFVDQKGELLGGGVHYDDVEPFVGNIAKVKIMVFMG